MTGVSCTHCGREAAEGARFCVNCGAQMGDPAAATLVVEASESDLLLRNTSRELGREYQIEREIGRGGMAIVYEAVDIQLGRRVALKVLPPEMALRKSMADRFKREAKMAAALDHPNIVPVYRVGQSGGLLYIAMKFIRGRPLDEVLESQGPLPIPVVLHIMRAATSALAYAHERGIVHRDVKSANIIIDSDGRAVVSDFGIARAIEEPNMTATGTVVGTPYFMSPEQCAARRIGPQSDQYSLGVVAFQMLTGTVPFSADTLPGIMHHHFYTPVPSLGTARPEIPAALDEVVQRLLQKKSEHRFASTQALADAIQAIPISDADRREAERLLRDLAGGAPIPPIHVGKLPALQTAVRLTPADLPTIANRLRRLPLKVRAAAAASLMVVVAAGGWWMRSAASTEDTPAGPLTFVPIQSAAPTTNSAKGSNSELARPRAFDSIVVDPVGTAQHGSGRAAGRQREGPTTTTALPLAEALPRNADSGDPRLANSERTTPPANEAGGTIRVRVDPASASIYVDGRLLGQGVVIDSVLPPGTHRLRVVAPGYETYEESLEIVSGQPHPLVRVTLRQRGDDS